MGKDNNSKNIVLIGMSGVGKTTVGKHIANKLNMEFVDTDDIIISTSGKTISHIFKEYGEEHFRMLEKEVIYDLLSIRDTVIATGGGVILDKANIERLKVNGVIFFLEASIDTLAHNIKTSSVKNHRPLLEDNYSMKSRIKELYDKREKLYIDGADYNIKIDNKSISKIGDEIIYIFNHIDPCS